MELFAEYCRAGFALCPIAPGHKSPIVPGWQLRENAITEPAVAELLPGVGLCHAYSGTACLDIDDYQAAADWAAMQGLDLDALWNDPFAVKISSGRPNRGKLLYRMSEPLASYKVIEGKQNIIDFRCASRRGTSVQDALPGTVHPGTGKPYVWIYDEALTHWSTPPELPEAWRKLWEQHGAVADPIAEPPPPPVGAEADLIRKVLATKDPDMDRDGWVKVLSKLHHETQGSEMGLALANEWSARGTKYGIADTSGESGFDCVRTRWLSFDLNHPRPATLRGDIEGRPAEADEFGPVPTVEEQTAATAQDNEDAEVVAAATRKAATEMLEQRLVYVVSLDSYFDTERNALLPTDHAVRHLLTSAMPWVRTASGGKSRLDPVTLLRNSGKKRVADLPGFHPGEGLLFTEHGRRFINEYLSDGIQPVEPTIRQRELLDWLFGRIADENFRKWLLQFYGHAIQRPGTKILSAPLIWSETTGNGKSAMLQDVPRLLFGQRYSHNVGLGELESPHNDYLIGKWFIHMSEMHMNTKGDRRKIEAKLKAWITDPLAIHPKGKGAYTTRNNLIITGASNYEDAAAIDDNDRRWGIYELTAPKMTAGEGAALFDEFLKKPGDAAAAAVRGYFMDVDLTGFVPTAPAPVTAARTAMVDANLPDALAIIRDAVRDGDGPFQRDMVSPGEVRDYLQAQGLRNTPSPNWLGRALQKPPMNFVLRQFNSGDMRARLYIVRNLPVWEGVAHKQVLDYWSGIADPLLQ